jgi:hypothetical protein
MTLQCYARLLRVKIRLSGPASRRIRVLLMKIMFAHLSEHVLHPKLFQDILQFYAVLGLPLYQRRTILIAWRSPYLFALP